MRSVVAVTGIVFIRHAATDMAGTFCGQSDPPVNALGRRQIDDLAARLSDEAWDVIYSSDLRRAVATAKGLVRGSALEVVTTPRLREIDFGAWEGLCWRQIEEVDRVYAQRWIEGFPALPAPSGESFPDFEGRVLGIAEELLRMAETKRIAVVAHGGVMRVVLRSLLGYTEQAAWELTKPYCCLFTVDGATRGEVGR